MVGEGAIVVVCLTGVMYGLAEFGSGGSVFGMWEGAWEVVECVWGC